MEVGLNTNLATLQMSTNKQENKLGIKNLYNEKVTGDELKELKKQIEENTNAFTFKLEQTQVSITAISVGKADDKFQEDYEEFQNFLKDIGYNGKKIADLSQDEAKELVSEDGFFGIDQTSQRIADFVIKGANGDEDLLKAGLEGIMQGFDEAEKIWGDTLPDISYKTIDKAKELITKHMAELGFNALDTSA